MASIQEIVEVKQPFSRIRSLNRYILSRWIFHFVQYTLMILVALVWSVPFVWIVVSSLKVEGKILTYPVVWIPDPLTFEHYTSVLNRFPLLEWFLNSAIVSGTTVLISTSVVCLGAYAFARMKFRGRNFLYMAILTSFLLPGEVTLVPLYLGFSKLGNLDSYFSLISVGIADAFNLFLLTQYFKTFPPELEEAALIDGSNRLGILKNILLPLSRPALITVILFKFFSTWNDFTWPLIAINSDAHRTLPVGIATFVARSGSMSIYYGIIMAGAILACIPALIIFFSLQRYFIQGIATTGLK